MIVLIFKRNVFKSDFKRWNIENIGFYPLDFGEKMFFVV